MKYRYFLIIFILVIIVDRLTKLGVIISGREFTKNPGIAFGFGQSVPGILFFIIALGLVALIYYGKQLDFKQKKDTPSSLWRGNQIGLGLIFAGGISNILDRVFYGYVIDFIRFFSLSVFNLADVAIIVGCVILLKQAWSRA